jgi:hypothetical protein
MFFLILIYLQFNGILFFLKKESVKSVEPLLTKIKLNFFFNFFAPKNKNFKFLYKLSINCYSYLIILNLHLNIYML